MNFAIYKICYLLAILLACAASIYQSYNRPLLRLFAASILSDLIAEVLALFATPAGQSNHYIYATNIVVESFFMLAYMFGIARKRLTRIFCAMTYVLIVFTYLSKQMWRHDTMMTITEMAVYNMLVSLCSLLLVWDITVSENTRSRNYSLLLIAIVAVYNIFSFLNVSFNFTEMALKAGKEVYMVLVSVGVNVAFYVSVAIACLRLPKPVKIHAA